MYFKQRMSRSTCSFRASHQGICCPLTHSYATVSTTWRPWSNWIDTGAFLISENSKAHIRMLRIHKCGCEHRRFKFYLSLSLSLSLSHTHTRARAHTHTHTLRWTFLNWWNLSQNIFECLAMERAHSEDTDQTARTHRLIRVFAGRTCSMVHFLN